MSFPKNFAWGAATASYQIEGAAFDDGKGLSVWDMFCRKEGTIWNQQTGDVACDHYHRSQEDVALMKTIGLNAYRFSVAWARVLPNGVGAINDKGLAFYDRLVDELLAANIVPYVTLFHWDYPYEPYCRGGWLNSDSANWFAEYTRIVVDKLSDRVQHWITLNEPQCFIGLGHQDARHAPGDRLGLAQILRAAHNTLLAHGKAVQVIRARARKQAIIGYAPVDRGFIPATHAPADIEAARRAKFAISGKNVWNTTWFSDPIFFKKYPDEGMALFGSAVPEIGAHDMDIIGQPVDFYGVNIYQGEIARADANGEPEILPFPVGHPLTAFRWYVTPEALYWGPRFYWERYRQPIIITENGISNIDWVSLDGQVHDPQRIDFTRRYLLELDRAIQDGVDVRGYFHWTLTDNFEWAEGVKERFGLIYTNFVTQQRILKDSAHWYKQVIATNGASLHD